MNLTSNKYGVIPPLKWGNRNFSRDMFSVQLDSQLGLKLKIIHSHLYLDDIFIVSIPWHEQDANDRMANSTKTIWTLCKYFSSESFLCHIVTYIVYVCRRSSGPLLFKHSDETFTATPDAYLAYLPPCPIIETYGTEERDLVYALAIQGLGNAGMRFWILGRCR